MWRVPSALLRQAYLMTGYGFIGAGTQGNSCLLAHFHELFNQPSLLLAKPKQNSNLPQPHMSTCLSSSQETTCAHLVPPPTSLPCSPPIYSFTRWFCFLCSLCHHPPSLHVLADGPHPAKQCCLPVLPLPATQLLQNRTTYLPGLESPLAMTDPANAPAFQPALWSPPMPSSHPSHVSPRP